MKNILLILFSLFFLSSCGRKTNSSNGNYFNCRVNGIYWEPDKGGLGEYTLTAKLLYNQTVLSIDAVKGIEDINIGIIDTLQVEERTYSLAQNLAYHSAALYDNNNSTNQYETDSSHQGLLTLTKLDKTNMKVEGTFHFKAFNSILNDSVNITDGRFSIGYTDH